MKGKSRSLYRAMTEDVAVEMHHAALPTRMGQIVGNALKQSTAGIRDDQLNASQAQIDKVTKERRPARLVFFSTLINVQNLLIAVARKNNHSFTHSVNIHGFY